MWLLWGRHCTLAGQDEVLPLSLSIWFCHHSLDGLLTPMASRSEGDQPLSCPSLVSWWDTCGSLLPPPPWIPVGMSLPVPGRDGCGHWSLAPGASPCSSEAVADPQYFWEGCGTPHAALGGDGEEAGKHKRSPCGQRRIYSCRVSAKTITVRDSWREWRGKSCQKRECGSSACPPGYSPESREHEGHVLPGTREE